MLCCSIPQRKSGHPQDLSCWAPYAPASIMTGTRDACRSDKASVDALTASATFSDGASGCWWSSCCTMGGGRSVVLVSIACSPSFVCQKFSMPWTGRCGSSLKGRTCNDGRVHAFKRKDKISFQLSNQAPYTCSLAFSGLARRNVCCSQSACDHCDLSVICHWMLSMLTRRAYQGIAALQPHAHA